MALPSCDWRRTVSLLNGAFSVTSILKVLIPLELYEYGEPPLRIVQLIAT